MRLSLLVLLAAVAPAHAQQLTDVTCDRSLDVVPLRGSVDVPSNARIWIAGQADSKYELRDRESTRPIPPVGDARDARIVELRPALAASRGYVVYDTGRDVTAFTVGPLPDHTPPQPPDAPDVLGGRLHVTVDEDTALLRVELRDADHPAAMRSFLTTAFDRACRFPVLAPGSCVRLTAIDLAGNESSPVERCRPAEDTIAVAFQGHDHGSPWRAGPHVLLALAFVVAMLVGVFIVFAPEIDMGWLRRRSSGDALLPAAARQLARTTCHDAVVRGGMVAAGGALAIVLTGNAAVWFLALAMVLVTARQLWVFSRAQRMLRLLDGDPTVTLHGDHVLRVRSRGEASWLVCSQRQLAAATECVLPLARVRGPR